MKDVGVCLPKRIAFLKIGFIGLGKLGRPCAEVMAERHEVTGYDPNTTATQGIRGVRVVSEMADAIRGRDLILVAVPTPHDQNYDGRAPVSDLPLKDFSYETVRQVLKGIDTVQPESKVVLISTVLPGTVRPLLAPLLPKGTLIYNPYFIAMGTVREDFLHPEMLPVGTASGEPRDAAPLTELYRSLLKDPPIVLGTWEEAEAIKIFYNTFISFKLSFVNMILDVAERVGHMNVDVVTQALTRANQRILSPMYMKAGMGDGGPCHPRDNIALRELARRLNLGYDLFSGIVTSREVQAKNMAAHLASFGRDVCILGVGFKPRTALVDGSYSLLVAHYLRAEKVKVSFYDPLAGYEELPTEPVTYLLAHPYGEPPTEISYVPGSTVVDPWRTAPLLSGCEVRRYGDTRGT